MFSVRRWWGRHGLPIVLTGLALGTAWLLYQTQGAAISELYYLVVRPFEAEPLSEVEAKLTNARIQELEGRLAEVESENQKLKKLLNYAQQQQQAIAAPVVGRSADSWWKHVIIGRGRQDGIREGFAVSGIGGVVGRVVQVTPHTSRVLLISDPTSRVGITVSRSRQMGFMQGQGSQTARLQFFEKVPDVRAGDQIATSGLSRLYPPGLPVGRVKSVSLKSGPAPEAIVELTAPLDSLEWVLVHPFEPR